MCKNVKTVSECLRKSETMIGEPFTEREKRQLMKQVLQHVLNCEVHDLISRSDIPLTHDQMNDMTRIIGRINNGEPFQYVLSKSFFYDHEFISDSRALIPRPETEELVHTCIEILNNNPSMTSVLDIGTGSGCIALSIKKALSHLKITGIDISTGSLELARENATLLNVEVDFLEHDILESILNNRFDLIVSNPPYIPSSESESMENNVLSFEPSVALFVPDDDPILFYKRIADAGQSMLKKSGYLAFEIHENLAEEIQKYLNLKGYRNIQLKKDLQGKDRMIFAQL